MRICFLEGDMSRHGGTERMTALLANALSAQHQVFIISLNFRGGACFFDLLPAVRHQILSPAHGKFGILRQITEIRQIIKRENIDRIVNVDIGMGLYGIPAAIGTGAKVITWEHSNFFNNWGSRFFPYLRRFAAKHSDAMVVLTQRDKENYRSYIPSCAPLYVIPNPVESHPISYDPTSKIILSAGLLAPVKRFDRAIEIAEKVLAAHPGWTWIICGEGPERKNLEHLIAQAGLGDRVFLPGSIKDMDEQYRRAAIYVMTSDTEGLPMVLLEAKSWGLPIVSFDIMTGPSDIVTDGVNGDLIPAFDLDAMADSLESLMRNDQLRQEYSAHATEDIDRYHWTNILSSWEEVLQIE